MNVPSPVLLDGVLACEGGITPYWQENSRNKQPEGTFPPNPNKKFKHWMVGLDAATGELVWDIGPLNAGGYGGPATPMPLRLPAGGQQVGLVLTGEGHLIRMRDGKLISSYIGTRAAFASPMPLGPDKVIFSHVGSVKVAQLAMTSPEQADCRQLWTAGGATGMGGAVVHDGLIYTQSSGKQVTLAVFDAATGRRVHQGVLPMQQVKENNDWPNSASAGKYVFLFGSRRAAVLEPGLQPRLLAVSDVEQMFSGPVFDGDRMYLRTYDSILCIARKGEEGATYEKHVQARTLLAALPEKLQRRKLVKIDADGLFDPGKGVPIVRLDLEKMPDRWLFCGPLPAAKDADPLEALGGCAAARPDGDTQVTFGGKTAGFTPLGRKFMGSKGLDADGPVAKDRSGLSFYYTVLEVAKRSILSWQASRPGISMWLGGRHLQAGQAAQLTAGRHPLLMKVAVPADYPASADMRVQVLFAETPHPDEAYEAELVQVRSSRDVLKRVIALAPGTESAARAADLLKRAQ